MFILLCLSRHALHLLNNLYYMLLLLRKVLKTKQPFYRVLLLQIQLGASVTIAHREILKKKTHSKQQKITITEKPPAQKSPRGKPPHTIQTKGFFSPL